MFRAILYGIIGALTFANVTAKAAELRHWRDGPWFAGAYTNDQTGHFSHCAMSASYKSGIYMVFSISREFTWALGFADPLWHLTPGAVYNLSLTIDRTAPVAERAVALSTTMVSIGLQSNAYLFQRFRRGYRLRVDAVGRSFFFNLTGTARALSGLLACTQHYVVASAPSLGGNPFVARSPASPSGAAPAQFVAEATAVIANVLSQAKIVGFHILVPNERPAAWSKFDAVWIAPGVVGVLNVVPPGRGVTVGNIRSILIGAAARACQGKFASGSLVENQASPESSTVLFTACSTPQLSTTAYYNPIPRPAGGYYVFATFGTGANGPEAEKVEKDVSTVALQAYRTR